MLQQSGWNKTIDDPQYLVLHNVTEKNEGWYTCLVANSIGMNYVSAWLKVVNGKILETNLLRLSILNQWNIIWVP